MGFVLEFLEAVWEHVVIEEGRKEGEKEEGFSEMKPCVLSTLCVALLGSSLQAKRDETTENKLQKFCVC